MKFSKILSGIFLTAIIMMLCSCVSENGNESSGNSKNIVKNQHYSSEVTPKTAEIKLIGHSSVKIKMSDGRVIYIDPAYDQQEGAYDEPADVILVTHNHSDHNRTNLITKNDDCVTITQNEAILDGVYQKFEIYGLIVEAVPAENENHDINYSVGYLISFDDITVYHAGDTSTVKAIIDLLKLRRIDYAFYPIDGEYNMDAEEATKLANTIGAKHNIPMHISNVLSPYDEEKAKTFAPSGSLYIPYGEAIEIEVQS